MSDSVRLSATLTELANRHGTDKGDAILCGHDYARVYETLLDKSRHQPLRLLEIGLIHGHIQNVARENLSAVGCPSLRMWAEYLPRAHLFGFDRVDFRSLAEERASIHVGDQANRTDLARLAAEAGTPFDVIVDDGSHASHHQQISLGTLFRHLAPGGIYCIEDLHYQPVELEIPGITSTRDLLRTLRHGGTGSRVALDQAELGYLVDNLQAIFFFDSRSRQWPLATTEDALAVLVKKGGHEYLDLSGLFGEKKS